MPSGVSERDIARIQFVAHPGRRRRMSRPVVLRGIRKLFLLDEDYRPKNSVFTWAGEALLDPLVPERSMVTFEVR